MNGNRSSWPRGKMLGGSSAMNAMLYIRGNERDYNNWHAAGNPTWGWDDVMPFFKKSERNLRSRSKIDATYHGFDGLLNVDAYPSDAGNDRIKRMLRDCFAELGYNEIDDINADRFLGFVRSQGTISQGMRNSVAKAFLSRNIVGDRKNLHIIKMAHVTKVIFDQVTSKRATGVEFIIENGTKKKLTAKARKEVILSAGAINSPQLLLLSGIGRAEDLEQHHISVALDAPGVGKNLQDHIIVPYVVSFHKSSAHVTTLNELSETYYQYLLNRVGTLSNLGSTDYTGFISTVNDPLYPDIQFMNFMFEKQTAATVVRVLQNFNYNQDIIDSIVAANQKAQTLLIFIILLNPKSRGSIELRSTDPFDAPKIFSNYFREQTDVDKVMEALRILNRLPATKAFNDHEGELVRVNITGCAHLVSTERDAYWQCYVRHMASTLYHPVGTVKMGTLNDIEAVVDAQLKVKGIDGLRVADASIMPTIVSANTNAAAIMIGEKAADFIAEHWRTTDTTTNKDEL